MEGNQYGNMAGNQYGNMAGSIPSSTEEGHDFRQPVNPDAKGAAMGAKMLYTAPEDEVSRYEGSANLKKAGGR